MPKHLVVTEPFGDFRRGDAITDADEIARVEANHGHHVVPVGRNDPPPAADKKKSS